MPGADLVVPSASASTAGTGWTLLQYVEDLAEQLGTYAEYVVSTEATSGEANRLVLVDELRDDEEARDFWAGGYVYPVGDANVVPQAGQQRRILREGYHGPLGGLVVSRPWTASLDAGTVVILTEPLGVREHLGRKGLTDLVNEALGHCVLEARIPFTGNGTRSHSLAAYPWIRAARDVLGIRDRLDGYANEPTVWSPYPFDINTNGATVTLEPGYAYATGSTFELVAPVRADRLIYAGSTWAYTATPGLVADGNQAAAPIKWVTAFGMRQGLRELAKLIRKDGRLSPAEKQEQLAGPGGILERYRQWRRTCARIVLDEFPRAQAGPVTGLVGGVASAQAPGWY